MKNAGADLYCFHYEAAIDSTAAEGPEETTDQKTSPKELVKYVHSLGMRAGVAIKPGTDVSVLYPLLDSSDPEEVPDVSTDLTKRYMTTDADLQRWPS